MGSMHGGVESVHHITMRTCETIFNVKWLRAGELTGHITMRSGGYRYSIEPVRM